MIEISGRWVGLLVRAGFGLAAVFAFLAAPTSPGFAHERRVVGAYELVVGWRDEPAVMNVPNAVSVEIRETASGHAVDGIHGLIAEVTYGGLQRAATLGLQPVGSAHPGAYVGALTPTRAGDYTFRIRGEVGSQAVDERFESGPGRFDPVKAGDVVTYPDAVSPDSLNDDLKRTQLVAFAALAVAIMSGGALILAVLRNRRANRTT